MKSVRKLTRRYYGRQVVASVMVCLMLFGMPTQVILADTSPAPTAVPTPGDVTGSTTPLDWTGSAGLDAVIDTATGNQIIEWSNFDIGSDASVTFLQNGGFILNNVSDVAGTGIFGDLTASSCGILVVNPHGLVIGPQAFVDCQSFIASSLEISDSDFLSGVFQFSNGDVAGNVTNNGTIVTEKLAGLIGKNVINRGLVRSENGYAIMAAGESVMLSDPTASNITVQVDIAGTLSDYDVDNRQVNNGGPATEIDAKNVILAAGDIFSTAIEGVETLRAVALDDAYFYGDLTAEAVGASDAVAEISIETGDQLSLHEDITVVADGDGVGNAVATVTIVTGDDDFVINDDITAEAYTSGDFDATATVDITATGKVTVKDGSSTDVSAEAYDGIINSASVGIDATGDIQVLAEGSSGDVTISAEAYNGEDNIAQVDLDSEGDVMIQARKSDAIVTAEAYSEGEASSVLNEAGVSITGKNVLIETYYGATGFDPAVIGAYASDAEENNAKVEITANGTEGDGDVDIKTRGGDNSNGSDNDDITIEAIAEDGINNDAEVSINASKDIHLRADSDDEESQIKILASANNGVDNDALVELNAEGNVRLEAEDQITVTAEAYGGEVGATSNKAQVNIDATDVSVEGEDFGSENAPAQILASASDGEENEAGVSITADEDVTITGEGRADDAVVRAEAFNGDENKAEVIIDAEGDVEILSDNQGDGDGKGVVEALAYNEEEAATLNDADVEISGDNVTVEDRASGSGDGAIVLAEAYNGATNNANVDVEATGNVSVIDNGYGSDSPAQIVACASDGDENTAEVKVDAEGDVEVIANARYGLAAIEAYAGDDDEKNDARVEIVAEGDVRIEANGYRSRARVRAKAEDGVDNDAEVFIDAGGSVSVEATNWRAHAEVKAQAREGENNNAKVKIEAIGDVTVKATNGGEADIDAIAENATNSINTASVDIDIEGDLKVQALGYSTDADIDAQAEEGEENTADVDIFADDVLVEATDGGNADIDAEAREGVDNKASVDIDAEGKVQVIATAGKYNSDAEIQAIAENIEVGNDGPVVIEGDLENEATVTIEAKSVDVHAEGNYNDGDRPNQASIEARAANEIYGPGNKAKAAVLQEDEPVEQPDFEVTGSVTNEAKVDIIADGSPQEPDGDEWADSGEIMVRASERSEALITADAYNEFENESGDAVEVLVDDDIVNKADIKLDAKDDVEVRSSSFSLAEVKAEAENVFEDMSETDPASLYITVEGDVENAAKVDIEVGEDVKIYAFDESETYVYAEADNNIKAGDIDDGWWVEGGHIEVYVEGDATNDAELVINAGEDVRLKAESASRVAVGAKADNEIEDYSYYADRLIVGPPPSGTAIVYVDGAVENTSNVSINAGEDLEITAYDSYSILYSYAFNYLQAGGYTYGPTYDQSSTNSNSNMISGHIEAYIGDDVINTADIDIVVADGVKVKAYDYSRAGIDSYAGNDLEDKASFNTIDIDIEGDAINTSDVTIDAGDHVVVLAEEASWARIGSSAENWSYGNVYLGVDGDTENTATIDIDAGGSVFVIADGYGRGPVSEAGIEASAQNAATSNTASINILANNVIVLGSDHGQAGIKALAAGSYWGGQVGQNDEPSEDPDPVENSASVNIETFTVDVELPSEEPETPSKPEIGIQVAQIEGELELQEGQLSELCETILEGGHVVAAGLGGGDATIKAVTYAEGPSVNTSDVLICAEGAVVVAAADCGRGYPVDGDYTYGSTAEIKALSHFGAENTSNVGIGAKLGLGVIAIGNAEASIKSKAMAGRFSNTADLVACTGGPLLVGALYDGQAEIKSEATGGYINDAYTGVCATGPVIVGSYAGYATIESEAGWSKDGKDWKDGKKTGGFTTADDLEVLQIDEEPPTSNAETVVVSKESSVVVLAYGDSYAGIESKANGGIFNNAYTGVCAEEHVLVAAAGNATAVIESKAYQGPFVSSGDIEQLDEQEKIYSTSDAETAVIAKKGHVAVLAGCEGEAGILSKASDAALNSAYTGVAAGADLPFSPIFTPSEETEPVQVSILDSESQFGEMYDLAPGSVIVASRYGDARIQSTSEGKYSLENTADTVVCAPGEVHVYSQGRESIAKIKSWARFGDVTTATTQVYAGAVHVDVASPRYGSGIGAWAQGNGDWVNHEGTYFNWYSGDSEPVLEQDGGATLIIDSYAVKEDCPDCPPCPDCPCGDDEPVTPPAPLAREFGEPLEKPEFAQGGCPALMQWLAAEIGLPEDQINVMLGNADHLATDIQPCEACARLKQQADAMAGLDPAQVNAWASAVTAGFVGPMTPETMAGIQTALADNPGALSFDNAAAAYVKILSEELGLEADEAAGVLTQNYTDGQTGLDAYVAARAAAL